MNKAIVLGLLALGGLVYAAKEANAGPKFSARRMVRGKSGNTWFTATLPPDDANTIQAAVFASEHGDDMVLEYRQVTGPTAGAKIGDRLLTFQSPTTLSQAALKDFGPFLNQGK
jgi:hypothetical protein